jgi:hypothetical protein
MNDSQATPTEQTTITKLALFWRGLLIGVRDYPRYLRAHVTMNRQARRKDTAQHGNHPHNAKSRPSWLGFWEGRKSGRGVRVADCPFALRKAATA